MLIVALFSSNDLENRKSLMKSDYIARINIEGFIGNDHDRLEALKQIANSAAVKALIVHINSPGGTVVGGESLYQHMRKISNAQKPVVVVMGDMAASAAYMTALGCDYLIASQGTLTGSIGVIAQTFEVSELAQRMGVKFKAFKSSPLKGGPLPTEALTPEMIESMNSIVNDLSSMFFDIVSERRSQIPKDKLAALANGQAYTGRQAIENGLIDAIGDEETALDWLKSTKNINPGLKIRDVELETQPSKWRKILNSTMSLLSFAENSTKTGVFSFL
jgi:protease-4